MFGVGARALPVLFASCVLLGCGGLVSHPSAAQWSEITSAHFAMWTDGDVGDARRTLEQMEHVRSIVLGVAFPTADDHTRILVVAFSGRNEAGYYLPRTAAANTRIGTVLGQPLITMAADANVANARILTHELTHAITFQFIRRQPVWFAEGIASFFETVSLDTSSAEVRVGEPSPDRTRYILAHRMDSVPTALACVKAECRTGEFYATAWAMITFLMNAHPTELARFEQALIATPRGPLPAWDKVVPELAGEHLGDLVRSWLLVGSHTVWRYKLHSQTWPTQVAKLPEANVHAIEGLILQYGRPDESREELAAALRLDPTNVVANLVVAERDHRVSLDTARRVVGAHANDWRAWQLLARGATGEEREAAQSQECTLLAKDPGAEPPADLICSTVPP